MGTTGCYVEVQLSDSLCLMHGSLGKPAFASLRRAWDFILSMWKSLGDVPMEPSSSQDCVVLEASSVQLCPHRSICRWGWGVTAPWGYPGHMGLW